MAHFTNSLRCGDHVWLRRHLHRRGQASGMRARDPDSELAIAMQQSRLHRNVIGTGRRHGEPKLLNRVQIDCEVDLG